MDTSYENRLKQLVDEMKVVKEELAKTKSALETYTKPPPSQARIEGSPFCTRFFISVHSSIKNITSQAFAKELFKTVPTNTDIYAVDRGCGFGTKRDMFLLEAFVITHQYIYIPMLAESLDNAFLNNGYYDEHSKIRNISILNLERVPDAICVMNDVINMQKVVYGSDQGHVIQMLPSGELNESIVTLTEINPYYLRSRREFPLVEHLARDDGA